MRAHLGLIGLAFMLLSACDGEPASTNRTIPVASSNRVGGQTTFDVAMIKLGQLEPVGKDNPIKGSSSGEKSGDMKKEYRPMKFRTAPLNGTPPPDLPPTDVPESKISSEIAKD